MGMIEDVLDWINSNYRIGINPLELSQDLIDACKTRIDSADINEISQTDKQTFQFSETLNAGENDDGHVFQVIIEQIIANSGKNFYIQSPNAQKFGCYFLTTEDKISGCFIIDLQKLQFKIHNCEPVDIKSKVANVSPKVAVAKKQVHSDPLKYDKIKEIVYQPKPLSFLGDIKESPIYEEIRNQIDKQMQKITNNKIEFKHELLAPMFLIHTQESMKDKEIESSAFEPITSQFDTFKISILSIDAKEEVKEKVQDVIKDIIDSIEKEKFSNFTHALISSFEATSEPVYVVIIGNIKQLCVLPEIENIFTDDDLIDMIHANINILRINNGHPLIDSLRMNAKLNSFMEGYDKSSFDVSKGLQWTKIPAYPKATCIIYPVQKGNLLQNAFDTLFINDKRLSTICSLPKLEFGVTRTSIQDSDYELIFVCTIATQYFKSVKV